MTEHITPAPVLALAALPRCLGSCGTRWPRIVPPWAKRAASTACALVLGLLCLDRGGPRRTHRDGECRGPGQHLYRGAAPARPFPERGVTDGCTANHVCGTAPINVNLPRVAIDHRGRDRVKGSETATLARRTREIDPDCRPLAHCTLDRDLPVMLLDDRLRPGQANARPLHAGSGGRTEKACEDARQVLGRDTDPLVAHGDHGPLLLGLHVQPFLGERGSRPQGFEYNWYGDRHMLRLWMDDPGPAEISSVEQGRPEFALTVKPPIIFLLFRFAPAIPWNMTAYSFHLLPKEAQILPPDLQPGADHAMLMTFLIGARDNVLRALRVCTLSPVFTFELHAAIRDQARAPFDVAAYGAALRRTDDAQVHPNVVVTRLLHQASVRCKGGD
jgi:hypothetical protein